MKYDISYFDKVINREGTIAGKWDGREIIFGKKDIIPMWVADTDFRAPMELIEAMEKRVANGAFGYAFYGGKYTDVIIDWQERRNNVSYKKESIFYINNVVLTISTVVRALTAEGDNIIVSTPSYGPLIKAPTAARRNVIKFPMTRVGNKYQIDFEKFEKSIEENDVKMYILCNPHNPTGKVWTKEELIRVFEICQRHDVIVISDEIHSDLILPGYHFTPAILAAREVGWDDHLIVASAPTKTFNIAGLQVSYYIVENQDFIKKINEEREYSKASDLLGLFGLIGIIETYKNGDSYVDALTDYLAGNFAYLKQELAAKYPSAKVTDAEATYLAWIDVTYLTEKGITPEKLKKSMVDHGVGIQTTEDFFAEDLCFRINLACPRTTLEQGLACVISCLNELSQ